MSLNWDLFDRLRAHIARLEPGRFNYWLDPAGADDDGGGCLACHCRALTGYQKTGWRVLVDELGVTESEARWLYGGDGWGTEGIDEALSRLDLVASRYTRPVISVEPDEIDRAFVLRCMAVAQEPLEVE